MQKVVILLMGFNFNRLNLVYNFTQVLVSDVCVSFAAELEHHHRNGLLSAIQRSLTKNTKAITDGSVVKQVVTAEQGSHVSVNLALGNAGHKDGALKENCPICSLGPILEDDHCTQSTEESSSEGSKENSMAIVPVQKIEAASSSISLLMRELPEIRPGWPLLRRAILSNKRGSNNSSVRQISVVQWALRLPSRHFLSIDSSEKGRVCDLDTDQSSKLDGECGAIVPVGNETPSAPASPDSISKDLPKELEGLHEKYSATCRLFKYQELVSATSNFSPGSCLPQPFV